MPDNDAVILNDVWNDEAEAYIEVSSHHVIGDWGKSLKPSLTQWNLWMSPGPQVSCTCIPLESC